MGAQFNEVIIETTRNKVRSRFDSMCRQDAYDYGHAGYTGSFAEKDDLEIVPPPKGRKTWTEDAARKHCTDTNDKWGPAQAYELKGGRWFIGGRCSS